MSRLTSMTACTSSYFLFKSRIATRAIHLPLHRSGDTGHVVLDEKRENEGNRDRTQQRPRHELTPIENITAHQFRGNPDWDRLLFWRRQKDEGVDELVPRQ